MPKLLLTILAHDELVHDVNTYAKDWSFQSKQAQEDILSRKSERPTHPPLVFNNNNVSQTCSLKHFVCLFQINI